MIMDLNLEYGELANDTEFVNKCETLKEELLEVQKVLDQLLPLKEQYDKLTVPAQIELDLLLAFTLNSLQWVNLKIKGEDLSKHPIKNELQRIKAMMLKWQQVKDREKRPTVNVEAAKRFVRSGLYDHKEHDATPNKNLNESTPNHTQNKSTPIEKQNGTPINKKIKFSDSDD